MIPCIEFRHTFVHPKRPGEVMQVGLLWRGDADARPRDRTLCDRRSTPCRFSVVKAVGYPLHITQYITWSVMIRVNVGSRDEKSLLGWMCGTPIVHPLDEIVFPPTVRLTMSFKVRFEFLDGLAWHQAKSRRSRRDHRP